LFNIQGLEQSFYLTERQAVALATLSVLSPRTSVLKGIRELQDSILQGAIACLGKNRKKAENFLS
jgi:hypothetical protein